MIKFTRLPALFALLALLAITATPVHADATTEVVAATQTWINAFNRKNAKDIVALYAADAVFFGTSSPVLRDKPELVWDYFKGVGDLGDFSIAMGEHRVQLFGKVAINTGYYTRTTTVDGKTVQNPARFTFVYQKRGGRWMIVEHHSSALPQ
jgi:uncharacterized protein (TIGR02246 family)